MADTTMFIDDVTGNATPAVTWSEVITWAGSTSKDVTDASDVTTHIFDTYTVFIHPHWRQFPLVSDGWHYIIGVVITLVGFSGIMGNSIVIYMFTSDRTLRTSSNMFIVNLAVSDMTFCVVNGFPLFSISAFNTRWIFGQAACEFYGLIGAIFGLMSINTMVAIAVDRYQAIARPIHQATKMSRKKAFLMIVTVWVWSLTSSLPPLFGWGRYIPEGFQTSCTFDYLTRTYNNRSYILFLYIFGFCVPLGVILMCYAMIVRAVTKHEKEMQKTAKKMNAELRTNQKERKMEVKVAKVSCTILVLFLMSWLPYATVALIGQFGDPTFVTPFWSEIPVIFAKASAMHNPIVYALSHPKFRAAVNKRLPWLLCCCQPSEKETEASQTQDITRGASKMSASSVVSEISNINDEAYAELEMRLSALEGEPGIGTRRRQPISGRGGGDIPAGKVIQDLTHALVELASTKGKTDMTPAYLPHPLYAPGTAGDAKPGTNKDGVFVLDDKSLPQLAKYLAEYSKQKDAVELGHVNPSLEMDDEEPQAAISNKPTTADTETTGRDKGARPKTIPTVTDSKGEVETSH